MRSVRIAAPAGLLAAAFVLVGCAARPVVSGKVSYRGEPLTTGEVSFVSSDGRSRSGLIGTDGRYEIADPPAGEVTILVAAKKVDGGSSGGSPLLGETKGKPGVMRSLIPERYADPKTSGLSYRVTGGKQTKDVELTE